MGEAVRVVFDTNVLLSLFVFKDSRFAPFRGEVVSGRWIALTSAPCLAEYRRVLAYPLFALDPDRQDAAYAAYLALVQTIDAVPQPTLPCRAARTATTRSSSSLRATATPTGWSRPTSCCCACGADGAWITCSAS